MQWYITKILLHQNLLEMEIIMKLKLMEKGKGNIWIEVKANGVYRPAKLVDVLHVPAFGKNLLSVSAVTKKVTLYHLKRENARF